MKKLLFIILIVTSIIISSCKVVDPCPAYGNGDIEQIL